MKLKSGYIYILANQRNGTIYIGVTGNLSQRVYQHKNKVTEGFTTKYGLDKLVYHEGPMRIHAAIEREKQLKKWNRQWKLNLIERKNPEWKDLYPEIYNVNEDAYEALS